VEHLISVDEKERKMAFEDFMETEVAAAAAVTGAALSPRVRGLLPAALCTGSPA
jgi:hypothetical protein